MDSARNVSACHSTQETRVTNVLADLASTIHQTLPHPHPGPRTRQLGGEHRRSTAVAQLPEERAVARVHPAQNLVLHQLQHALEQRQQRRARGRGSRGSGGHWGRGRRAGGTSRTNNRPKLNGRRTSGRVTGNELLRQSDYHDPSPRICMSIHPQGKSCSVLRSRRCSQ